MKDRKVADLVKSAFLSQETRTLDELYSITQKESDSNLGITVSKHQIRSIIYYMKKKGEINRIGDSTYKKV